MQQGIIVKIHSLFKFQKALYREYEKFSGLDFDRVPLPNTQLHMHKTSKQSEFTIFIAFILFFLFLYSKAFFFKLYCYFRMRHDRFAWTSPPSTSI